MIDIWHLEKELAAPSTELDTTDLRLARVLSLAATDRFIEAAEASQALWLDGYYDLRLIGYYLYGAFVEQGIDSLAEIMGCLVQVLSNSWDKLGPQQKKSIHADGAIKWLMSAVIRELKLHENLEDELWKRWNDGESAAPLRQALDRFADLQERVINLIPQPRSLPYVQQMESLLTKMERAAESVSSNKRASARRSAIVGFASLHAKDDEAGDSDSSGSSGDSAPSRSSSDSASSGSATSSSSSSSSSSSPEAFWRSWSQMAVRRCSIPLPVPPVRSG